MRNAVIWSQAVLKRGLVGGAGHGVFGQRVEPAGRPLRAAAWHGRYRERLTWLKRSEHKGDSRTEKGRHRLEMALSAKAEIFNSILKCKGKGRPSEEFKQ